MLVVVDLNQGRRNSSYSESEPEAAVAVPRAAFLAVAWADMETFVVVAAEAAASSKRGLQVRMLLGSLVSSQLVVNC